MTSETNNEDTLNIKPKSPLLLVDSHNFTSTNKNATPLSPTIIKKQQICSTHSSSSINSNSTTSNSNEIIKKKRLYIKKNENLNSNILINNNNKLSSPNNSSKMFDLNKDDGYVDDGLDIVDDEEDGGEVLNNSNYENDDGDDEDEPVDPRIQIELERLNKSSSDINKLENELEEAKSLFISTKNRQAQRIEYLQKKLGSCITKSKPYYDALQAKEKLQKETHKAVLEFQKAVSHYTTAKETLAVAEQTLSTNGISDVWQEYLSETITKINNYKRIADQAEDYHRNKAAEYQMCEKRLQFLEKDLRRNIEKSQSYYEEKSRWNLQMEAQRNRIYDIERTIVNEKRVYSEAMNNLRLISDEIHLNRRTRRQRLKQQINSQQPPRTPLRSPIKISKSLDNLVKTIDETTSTDDVTSECTSSYDAMSNDSKKSANEKRNLKAISSHKPIEEYFSFNDAVLVNNSQQQANTSGHSSRSCSPQYNQINSNNNNNNTNNEFSLDTDDMCTSSKSMYTLNRQVSSSCDSNEDIRVIHKDETYDSGKYSLTSFDAALNNVKLQKSLTAQIITSNPKINETIKIGSRLPATPPPPPQRVPSKQHNSTTQSSAKSQQKQEIPLLSNLLLYNSVLTKATNSLKNENLNGNESRRSSSFNSSDLRSKR